MSNKENRAFWLALLLSMVVFGTLAVVSMRNSTSASAPEKSSSPGGSAFRARAVVDTPAEGWSLSAAVQSNSAKQPVSVALITIRPTGFKPAEITRPRGRLLLAVDNRSGLHEVMLRLDRESGGRLHEERVPRGRLDWRKVFELQPGRYMLTEANHPGWVCRVTIIAQ